jgi:hypothetical protein
VVLRFQLRVSHLLGKALDHLSHHSDSLILDLFRAASGDWDPIVILTPSTFTLS